jgi:hypothetical protein
MKRKHKATARDFQVKLQTWDEALADTPALPIEFVPPDGVDSPVMFRVYGEPRPAPKMNIVPIQRWVNRGGPDRTWWRYLLSIAIGLAVAGFLVWLGTGCVPAPTQPDPVITDCPYQDPCSGRWRWVPCNAVDTLPTECREGTER